MALAGGDSVAVDDLADRLGESSSARLWTPVCLCLPTALIAAVGACAVGSFAACWAIWTRSSGVALVAILIHLMVSGGWTVPGVAIMIWIFTAMLTRRDNSSGPVIFSGPVIQGRDSTVNVSSSAKQADRDHSKDQASGTAPLSLALAIGCHVLILAAFLFRLASTGREVKSDCWLRRRWRNQRGNLARLGFRLKQRPKQIHGLPTRCCGWPTSIAGNWFWKGILVQDRRQWESCLADVKRRAGDDPAIYRMIGAQQLHAVPASRRSAGSWGRR